MNPLATPRWQAAQAYALVGERLDLTEPGHPDASRLILELAEAGWTRDAISDHARTEADAGRPWPHSVPAALRAGCGAAQLAAALARARELLVLVTLETRPPSARVTLDADERRLVRDVPPHHGG